MKTLQSIGNWLEVLTMLLRAEWFLWRQRQRVSQVQLVALRLEQENDTLWRTWERARWTKKNTTELNRIRERLRATTIKLDLSLQTMAELAALIDAKHQILRPLWRKLLACQGDEGET